MMITKLVKAHTNVKNVKFLWELGTRILKVYAIKFATCLAKNQPCPRTFKAVHIVKKAIKKGHDANPTSVEAGLGLGLWIPLILFSQHGMVLENGSYDFIPKNRERDHSIFLAT